MRNHAGAHSRDSTSRNIFPKKHAVVMPCGIAYTLIFRELFQRIRLR
jgi:hypothetical protein